ncbi:MBL fold metallo-hydrolase [Portibacter lacus]|uniref:Hydrolase n=1 Tax=Portibacter lacus TaxID=1099794 RepID=A0AA37SX15_9BACT|nr:MBL fold metallo-hydrolase [Portibacter lacus]GLR19235.1 hydrolase [Portibacter lacus]
MKITFLGTGTSQGIPVIACTCSACVSENPKDKRLRTSAFVEVNGMNICIDIGPDFRQQMLREKVSRLDAVVLTHEHNDHMIGADDLRPFNFFQKQDMPIFGEQRVLDEVKARFQYAFIPHPYPGIPQFLLTTINDSEVFKIGGVNIQPVRLHHGTLPILGYRIEDFCYLTDVKTIPEEEFTKLKGLKVLVLNALRRGPHHSHLTLSEALDMAKKIGAEKTYLTHFSHDLGPVAEWEQDLPEGVFPAWDGLILEI